MVSAFQTAWSQRILYEGRGTSETALCCPPVPEQDETVTEHGRSRLTSRIDTALVWLLAHASGVWPFVVFAVVLWLSWGAVREIHPQVFGAALRDLDPWWLGVAA